MATAFHLLRVVAKAGTKGLTCQEALAALELDYSPGSARFFALAGVKCIVPSGAKRQTATGAWAKVYVAPPNAMFLPYLISNRKSKGSSGVGLTTIQRVALASTMKFIHAWPSARTEDRQRALITRHVQEVVALITNLTEETQSK